MDRPSRGGVRSFTGTRRDGAVAPIPAARGTAIEPLESTHSGRSLGSPATTHDAPKRSSAGRPYGVDWAKKGLRIAPADPH